MKDIIIKDLESVRLSALNLHDTINKERILNAIHYIKNTSESNHDEDKLMELIEYCFKINKAQKKLLESQEIEIESLKLKLSLNPKETVKKVLIQDDKYKQRVVKAFAQLEEEYNRKDEHKNNLLKLSENLERANANLINKCNKLRRQLIEKGV